MKAPSPFVLVAAFAVACGAAQLTPQDNSELAQYQAEQVACLANPDKASIDACRAAVKAKWDHTWNQRFDGGFGG